MKLFRKMLFWLHLIVGCVAGLVIFVLCFTGLMLVFQGRVDHALMPRVVEPAPGTPRLTLEEVKAKLQTNGVGLPFEFVLHSTPGEPLQARWGHTRSVYLNPWTAEPIPDQALANRVHAFFFWNEEMHTRFGGGMRSAAGAAVTGAGTLVCMLLALSGIYLWWPRSLKPAALKSILLFRRGLKGKPRDWNWHNVIGFWTLIPMIVFLFTALVWSYSWVSRPFYKAMGVQTSARGGGGHAAPAAGAAAGGAVAGARGSAAGARGGANAPGGPGAAGAAGPRGEAAVAGAGEVNAPAGPRGGGSGEIRGGGDGGPRGEAAVAGAGDATAAAGPRGSGAGEIRGGGGRGPRGEAAVAGAGDATAAAGPRGGGSGEIRGGGGRGPRGEAAVAGTGDVTAAAEPRSGGAGEIRGGGARGPRGEAAAAAAGQVTAPAAARAAAPAAPRVANVSAPAQPQTPPAVHLNQDELAAAVIKQVPNWNQIELPIPRNYNEPLETMAYDPQKWYQGGPHGMTQVMLDPITGQVVKSTPFEARDMGLKLHALLRSWHTGDEWGILGQIIAAISCIGALVLVWTGYALTWRRYINYRNNKKRRRLAAAAASQQVAANEMASV